MIETMTPELAAWIEAQEVARRWYWPDRYDGLPLPQFVADEIARCRAAHLAAKARLEQNRTPD